MIGSMLFAFSAYNTQSGPVAVAGWMWLRVSNQSGHAEVDNPLKCEPHSPRTCNDLWGGRQMISMQFRMNGKHRFCIIGG